MSDYRQQQEQEEVKMNIYQKINAIRTEVDYIQKDKNVSTGSGGSYKAVTHDAVTGILRKHLIKYGVVCVPNQLSGQMADPRREDQKQLRYEGSYQFEFVNCDNPEEKITIRVDAHAMDNADKAPGKAISYAKKYAVLKLFEIETGEDEESRYQERDIEYINTDQLTVLVDKIKESGADPVLFAKYLKVDKFESLPAESFGAAIKALDKKIKEKENAAKV